MSKSILLAPLVVLIGAGLAFHTGVIDKPSFGVKDKGDWGKVTDNKTEIVTQVWIDNPNPSGLNLSHTGVSYQLVINDVKLAEGRKDGIILEEGNQTKKLRTYLINQNIPVWWARHIQKDEKSQVEVPINLYLEEPVGVRLSGFKYQDSIETDIEPIMHNAVQNMNGSYYGPQLLTERPEIQIKDGSARFGEVNQSQTELIFNLDIHNPNSYPIPAPQLTGNLNMNQIELANWDANKIQTTEQDKTLIMPDETQEVAFKAEINNSKIDDWLVKHIENGEKTSAEFKIKLKFELEEVSFTAPTGEGMKCNFEFQTAILVDDQKSSSQFDGCETPTRQLLEDTGTTNNPDTYNKNKSENNSDNILDRAQILQ